MVMEWMPRRGGRGYGMWKQISPMGGFILRSLRILCHPWEHPVMSGPSSESDYRCWSSSQSCSLRLSCIWCSRPYSFRAPAANQVLPSFRKHHSGNSRSWLFHRKAFQTKPAEGKQTWELIGCVLYRLWPEADGRSCTQKRKAHPGAWVRTSRRDLYFVVFIITRMWAVSTAHCVAQWFKWDHRVASWGVDDNIKWIGKTLASKDAGIIRVVGYVGLTPARLTKMVTGVFQVRVWALEVLTTWTWQLPSIGLLQRQSNSKKRKRKKKEIT